MIWPPKTAPTIQRRHPSHKTWAILACQKEMWVCPWEHPQYVSQLTSRSPPAQSAHKLIMAKPQYDLLLMSPPSQEGMPWLIDTAWVACLWAPRLSMISPESSGHYDIGEQSKGK